MAADMSGKVGGRVVAELMQYTEKKMQMLMPSPTWICNLMVVWNIN
jgi:hypothetical protein